MGISARDRVVNNPFYVLDVTPSAPRAEVERAGQRWLALLGIESAAAAEYSTPLGKFTRDADGVRTALTQLRDPEQRVLWELWAETAVVAGSQAIGSYAGASELLGWRPLWRSR